LSRTRLTRASPRRNREHRRSSKGLSESEPDIFIDLRTTDICGKILTLPSQPIKVCGVAAMSVTLARAPATRTTAPFSTAATTKASRAIIGCYYSLSALPPSHQRQYEQSTRHQHARFNRLDHLPLRHQKRLLRLQFFFSPHRDQTTARTICCGTLLTTSSAHTTAATF
jgi:hypothetical protein